MATINRSPGPLILVKQVQVSEIIPLRAAVLRPGKPLTEAQFSGDLDETTTHWAAYTPEGEVGAVASLYRAPHPQTQEPAWQLRGMASHPALRGKGYGAAALKACTEWVRSEAQREGLSKILFWCNARVSAIDFYRAHGWVTEGDVFEIPGVGPHYVMRFQPEKTRPSPPLL